MLLVFTQDVGSLPHLGTFLSYTVLWYFIVREVTWHTTKEDQSKLQSNTHRSGWELVSNVRTLKGDASSTHCHYIIQCCPIFVWGTCSGNHMINIKTPCVLEKIVRCWLTDQHMSTAHVHALTVCLSFSNRLDEYLKWSCSLVVRFFKSVENICSICT